MNLRSLYVKILLSFSGVFLVAGILIITLFVLTAGQTFKHNLNRQSLAKLSILKTIIQQKAEQSPDIPINRNTDIREMLYTFSDLFDVSIWLKGPDGFTIFQTAAPGFVGKRDLKHPDVFKDGIKLYYLSKRHLHFYAQIPLHQNQRIYTLHILLEKKHAKRPEAFFLFGLLTIGLVIAILVVPLSRFITKRLKHLHERVLAFADGNLSSRTDVKGRDEIARLGESFNFMADRLEKMISDNRELTANISHELRSPLTRIRVTKELLQEKIEEMDDSDLHRYAAHIDQEIGLLDDLIDKILKLSKINLQTPSAFPETLDLGRLILDLAEKYRTLLDKKELDLVVDIKKGLLFKADKAMLVSILSNLMDNAVKFTPGKGTIWLKACVSDTGRICLSIVNPCQKLDEIELVKIFDPFYRLKSNSASGSGLGLTLVKKQIEQCGGTIAAENSPEGLCFKVQFQVYIQTG